MPSTISWRGDAPAVAQLDTITIGGTWATSDIATITCNGKLATFVVGATTTVQAVVTGLAAAWNASTNPEMMEVTATPGTTTIVMTADSPGKPFTITVSKTSTSGTISNAHTTTSSGPNDAGLAANYSTGSLPTTGDTLIIENTPNSLLYGLSALSAVTLALLDVRQSFTGTIGLPNVNGSSGNGSTAYYEYRPKYFQVGATVCIIGDGNGTGSGRVKIDFGSVTTTTTVLNSGSPAENNLPVVLLKGTSASNVLNVLKGNVAVAYFAGEVSTLATLNVGYVTNLLSDATVQCPSGVTLTTVMQAGGNLTINSNVTTFTQDDGKATVGGSATIGTGTFRGTVIDQSTGTWTTVTIDGVYDHRQSLSPKTITNLSMIAKAQYHDPWAAVTLTNPITAIQCGPNDLVLDVQPNQHITLAAF